MIIVKRDKKIMDNYYNLINEALERKLNKEPLSLKKRLDNGENIDYENLYEELLTEFASIRRPITNEFMLLAINPDSNRIGDPYFKMYNKPSWNKATKVARISFLEPKLIIHKSQGVQPWTNLTKQDIDDLNDYLDSPWKNHPGFTIWDGLKYGWNEEWGFEVGSEKEYIDGNYDELNKNNPSYLPSTLEIPDYYQLKN